ncbi:MAG: hypothetical protein RLW62_10675 [Gammaproteobacteria bacterium]
MPAADGTTAGVRREPCYFGAPTAQCFGWQHLPAAPRGDLGVVLCPTLGAESLSTHRALRALADDLAARGLPVLRFDYRATGDSADGPDGRLTCAGCIDDVCAALALVRGMPGVRRVCVVGVRLGAAFAVAAAARTAVAGLVLWGPVVAGRRFAREWKLLMQGFAPPADTVLDFRSGGFHLDDDFLAALGGLDLLALEPRGGPPCLVVERDELAPEDKLVTRLTALGLATTRVRPGGFVAGMLTDPHLSVLPTAAIAAIADWIPSHCAASANDADTPAPPLADTLACVEPGADGAAALREWPLDMTRTDGLFGIVTEPADPARADGRCIVLLNSGSMHHVGPNGMYVAFARGLAAQGARVCRADLSGIGDSLPRAGANDNDPYPAAAVDDVARLLAALRAATGTPARVALAGICSGAWASLHAALMLDGINDIVLINADFYGERSVVGKPATLVRPKDYAHYKHAARSWAKWKKLLSGRADLRKIVRVLLMQLGLVLAARRARAGGEQQRLDADLARLAAQGVRVGFVYSPGDGAAEYLAMHGAAGRTALARAGLLHEVTIEEADHTFNPLVSQARLGAVLAEWLRA